MTKKLLLILYVFTLLFSPPIFPGMRSMYLLAAISVLFMLVYYRKDIAKVYSNSNIGVIVKLFLGLSAYIAAVAILSIGFTEVYFVDSVGKMLLTGPVLAICVSFLITVYKRSRYGLNDALKIIMYAGLLQVALSLVAFLVPNVKDMFVAIMQANVGTAALFDPFQIEMRLFGFAGDMFDRFGYGMGIMTVLPALLAYNTGRLRYMMLIPLFIVSIILNSRTGLLVAIVTTLPIVLATLRKYTMTTKNVKAAFSGVLLVGLSIFGGVYAINGVFTSGNDNIQGYTISNFQSVFDYFSGSSSSENKDNTAELLFSDRFWELPTQAHELIFGTSHSKYSIKGISHSDVGYINDIWMFGILGAIIAYFVLAYFTLSIAKFGVQYKLLAVGLLLGFFVYQVKGVALWSANIGIALHILLVALVYYYLSDTKEIRSKTL